VPFYDRNDVAAPPQEKNMLKASSPERLAMKELAGEPVRAIRTKAPGNDEAFGGIKSRQIWVGLPRDHPEQKTFIRFTRKASAAKVTCSKFRARPKPQ